MSAPWTVPLIPPWITAGTMDAYLASVTEAMQRLTLTAGRRLAAAPPLLIAQAGAGLTIALLTMGFVRAVRALDAEPIPPMPSAHRYDRGRRSPARAGHEATLASSAPAGLVNLGNTCFMASVLQSLAACEHVVSWVRREVDGAPSRRASLSPALAIDETLLSALHDLWAAINANADALCRGEPPRGGNGQTAVPSAVFAALTNSAQRLGPGEGGAVNGTAARHFLSFRQQDAHELLTLLAAVGLEETRRLVPRAWGPFEAATAFAAVGAGRAPRLGLPVVTAAARESRLDADACRVACAIPLTGLLGTRIHCRVCRYTTPLRLETFTSLSLAIPPAGRDDRTRVEDLLAHYMRPEAIEGYACDRCRLRAWCRVADETLVEAERLVALAAAPSPLPASGKRGGKHGAAGASRKQPAKPRTAKAQQASLAVPHLAVVAEQARLLKQALASHHYSFASEGQSKITLIPRPPVAPDAVVQRTTVVVRWPPTLCIHIQRSAISPYGDVYKDRRPVIFRETLGVDAGVGGSIEGGWGPGGPGDMPAPGPASLPELHARLAERPGGQAVEYGLRAVVLHFGGHDSGHYTALRQVCVPDAAPPAEPSGAAKRRRWWYRVSDTQVEPLADPRHQVYGYGAQHASLLFYDRRSPRRAKAPSSLTSSTSALKHREHVALSRDTDGPPLSSPRWRARDGSVRGGASETTESGSGASVTTSPSTSSLSSLVSTPATSAPSSP